MPVNNFYSLFTAVNQHFICTLIRVFQKALFLHISHNFIQNLRNFSSFYTILYISCKISIHRFRIKYKRVPLFLHNNTLLHNSIYDIGSGKDETCKFPLYRCTIVKFLLILQLQPKLQPLLHLRFEVLF